MKKVALISLGCAKNLVDSERILGLIKNDDYLITNDKPKISRSTYKIHINHRCFDKSQT